MTYFLSQQVERKFCVVIVTFFSVFDTNKLSFNCLCHYSVKANFKQSFLISSYREPAPHLHQSLWLNVLFQIVGWIRHSNLKEIYFWKFVLYFKSFLKNDENLSSFAGARCTQSNWQISSSAANTNGGHWEDWTEYLSLRVNCPKKKNTLVLRLHRVTCP